MAPSVSISARRLFLVLADAAFALAAAFATEVGLTCVLGLRLAPARAGATAVAITLLVLLALYGADLYDPKVAFGATGRGARLAAAVALAALVLAVALVALRCMPSPIARVLPSTYAGAALAVSAARLSLPAVDRRFGVRLRVLLVGEGSSLTNLLGALRADGSVDIVGVAGQNALNLASRALAARAQCVIVATDERRGLPTTELLRCRLAGLRVHDAAGFVERELRRIPVCGVHPSHLIFSDGFERPALREALRRVAAFLTALALFLLAAPAMLLVAAAIKLDSEGPVFYRQVRVGRGGHEFTMLKFRTMRTDAEKTGARWARVGDSRVTRVGRILRRFRLDELPQVINVIRGDMGVVGPRPERPEFVHELRRRIPYYDLRLLVAPGITGWAQICLPYAASLEEARDKLEYDLYYVKNLSLSLDLLILLATVKVVLFGRGGR